MLTWPVREALWYYLDMKRREALDQYRFLEMRYISGAGRLTGMRRPDFPSILRE